MDTDERRVKLGELDAQFEALREATAGATPEEMKAISLQTADLTQQMLKIMNAVPGLTPTAAEDDPPAAP